MCLVKIQFWKEVSVTKKKKWNWIPTTFSNLCQFANPGLGTTTFVVK